MALTVIVEPNPGGHRFQAASFIGERARMDGEVLLLTSAGASTTEEYRTFLDGSGLDVEEPFPGPHPDVRDVLAAILAVARRTPVATVVVMEGDELLKRWWYAAARALRGLPSRPRVVFFLTRYPARLGLHDLPAWKIRVAKGTLVLAARLTGTLQRCAGFAGREETAVGWLVKRARDPIECGAHSRDRVALREELGLSADRRLVGISGGINLRKDPALVLAAILETGLDADLVLSGPFGEEIREWYRDLPASSRERIVVEDAFLSNERLDRYIAAVDVVALAMRLEGPSGIMGKALAAGVPVVSAGSRTRARELRATLGGVDAEPTAQSVGAALRRVLDGGGFSPDLSRIPLPTGETFAATVLGPPR